MGAGPVKTRREGNSEEDERRCRTECIERDGQARGVWVRDYGEKHKEIERQTASQGSAEREEKGMDERRREDRA